MHIPNGQYFAANANFLLQNNGDTGPQHTDIQRSQSGPAALQPQNIQNGNTPVSNNANPQGAVALDHVQIELPGQNSVFPAQNGYIYQGGVAAGGRGVNERTFADEYPRLARIISTGAAIVAFCAVTAITPVATLLALIPSFYRGCMHGEWTNFNMALMFTIFTPFAAPIVGGFAAGDAYNFVLGRLGDDGARNEDLYFTSVVRDLFRFRENNVQDIGRHNAEQQRINADIAASQPLDQNIKSWQNSLPENERSEIDTQRWATWTGDSTNSAWTGPLSAVLQKWAEGALKDPITQNISLAFASRMKSVLKTIQSNPDPFTPYLSTLGLSGLGTCRDRPLTVFMDLELRTQAYQTMTEVKAGTKSLQDMLDIAVKRFVFDETLERLASGMQLAGSSDPIEATLKAWDDIQRQGRLDIPALPYRLYATDLSPEKVNNVTNQVVDVVKQRMQDRGAINEFLAREESPVPWKKAVDSSLSPETRMKLEALNNQALALEAPEQGAQTLDTYFNSDPYKKYLVDLQKIQSECNQLQSANIRFDEAQSRWLIA